MKSLLFLFRNKLILILILINNSSPGWDNISSVILKLFIEEYITPLTYVINKSFETGKFPNLLKIAKLIPIFKSGDKTMVSNCALSQCYQYLRKFMRRSWRTIFWRFLTLVTHFIYYSFVFANIFLLAMLLLHWWRK